MLYPAIYFPASWTEMSRPFFPMTQAISSSKSKRRNEPLSEAWYNQPIYYKGNHREIYGHKAVIPWPSYTRRFDFELEIACVIGKKGRDISVQDAGKYIAGYSILNDFSARDIKVAWPSELR